MASFRDAQAGSGKKMKWTLHTHFEVDRSVPTKMEVTPTAGGEHDERAVMERMIEPDRTYVMDRGYAKFELFNRIVDAGSSYVCRIRDNSVFTVLEERPLTEADRAARVLSDQLISLGSDTAKDKPNHPVRLVVIKAKPHRSKGKPGTGSTGQNCDGFLRIATNLLDVPAEIIALLYHYRWTIEMKSHRRWRLPLLQASAGLPSSSEPFSERHHAFPLQRGGRSTARSSRAC